MNSSTRPNSGTRAGIFLQPFIDSANTNILWMFHYPTSDNNLGIPSAENPRGVGFKSHGQNHQEALLIAIDCRSGEKVFEVDLMKVALGNLGIRSRNHRVEIPGLKYLCIDQTKGYIMTNLEWLDFSKKMRYQVSLVIDKHTGAATMLPEGVVIGEPRGAISLTAGFDNGVVGMGGNFFFADDARMHQGDLLANRRHKASAADLSRPHHSLFRLDPKTMRMGRITEYGRRPAKTPFDKEDREPKILMHANGKLLVSNQGAGANGAVLSGISG